MSRDFLERTLRFLLDVDYTQWAALGGAIVVAYTVYRRHTKISLDDVPGPENPSFLYGALHSNSQWFVFGSIHAREHGTLQAICCLCRMLRQESSRTII